MARFQHQIAIFCLLMAALALQGTSFFSEGEVRESAPALSDELSSLGIRLRRGTEHRKDSQETPRRSAKCKSLVYQALLKLPEAHRQLLQELTLFYTKDGRRGLGGGGGVVLRCNNVLDSELVSVLFHEMGHLVDADYLLGQASAKGENWSGFYDFDEPVGNDDLSSNFYKISWVSEKEKKTRATELDFVSLYAMTDPFEDFAETYNFYRLHGEAFRELSRSNSALQQKYDFMKDFVFGGEEFTLVSSSPIADRKKRAYDITIRPFLASELFSQ